MKKWKRGRTLLTPTTRRWSREELDRNDAIEGAMIFSDFYAADFGRARELVCTMNTAHREFESNRLLVEHANEMLELLNYIAFPKRGTDEESWTIEDAAAAASNILLKINASTPSEPPTSF